MNRSDLDYFKKWFDDYTMSFYSEDAEDRKNIALKVDHTHNVCRLIVRIAGEESLEENQVLMAETIALFHDLGRFPQYAQFKTFRDSISVNHGKLGAEILTKEMVLGNLPENEQKLITDAVRFHNAFALPALEKPDSLFFLKMIRDADKLDIWRIFIEFYEGEEEGWKSVAGLGLPDVAEYSREIASAIIGKRTASNSFMKSLNDFKLLQLSWIYDLNFHASVRLLVEKDYIARFVRHLPRTPETEHFSQILHEYASERLKGNRDIAPSK